MSRHLLSRPRSCFSLLAAASVLVSSALTAQTWNGGGTTDNWSETLNWTGGVPVNGSNIAFAGSTRLTPANDLSALSLASITFSSGASSFILGGNDITLTGGLTNSSTNLQTINFGIALSSGSHTFNTGAGGLTLGGNLTGAGTVSKSGTGTLTLSGNNSFDGAVSITSGIVRATSATAFGSTVGATAINSGTRIELDATAGSFTVAGEALTLTGNGGDNNGALRAIGGQTATWGGNIAIGAGTGNSANRLGATGANSVLAVSGAITGTGDLAVRTDGSTGTKVVLSGTGNTWGNTYAVVGTIQLAGGNNRLPTGTILEIGNGSNASFAIVDLNGTSQQVAGLRSAGTTMIQTLTNTDLVNLSTFTINNAADFTFGSNIALGKGLISGNLALVKSGAGTFTLQGTDTNTFTGNTTVNEGVLVLAKASAGTLAIAGAVTVGDGTGQDILRLGQSQQIADASIVTLNGSGANAGIFQLNGFSETIAGLAGTAGIIENNGGGTSTLTLAIPVPAAADITQTLAALLRDGDSVGIDGSLGLTLSKTGAGAGLAALVINTANTYSGQTNIGANALLRISHADALGAGGSVASGTIVTSGGRLELTGGITVANETITINGAGGNPNSMGALRSVGASAEVNTWAGNVILGSGTGGGTSGTRVGAASGTTLRLLGQITDGGNSFDLGFRSESNTGIVVLGGSATNTWRDSYIVVGRVRLEDSADRLPTNSVLTLGNSSNTSSTEFDLNGLNQTIAGLADDAVAATMDNVVTNRNTSTSATLTINNSTDHSFGASNNNSILTGNLALVKNGIARQTLGSASTYTGPTTVNAGILQVGIGGTAATRDNGRTGNNVASNVLTAQTAGTVIGTGTIAGTSATTHRIASGGAIAPGDFLNGAAADPTGIGTLNVNGNLNAISGAINLQLGGSTLNNATLASLSPGSPTYADLISTNVSAWEGAANGTVRGEHDLLNISGSLSLDGSSLVSVSTLSYSPVAGDIFDVLDWFGSNISSDFNVGTNLRTGGLGGGDLNLASLNEGLLWDVSQFRSHGILLVVAGVVPEPSRALLLTLALGALVLGRRRRQ